MLHNSLPTSARDEAGAESRRVVISEAAVEGNSTNIRNQLKLVRVGGVSSTIFMRLLTTNFTDYVDFRDFLVYGIWYLVFGEGIGLKRRALCATE